MAKFQVDDPLLNFRWRVKTLPFELNVNYVERVSIPFADFEPISIYTGGVNTSYVSLMSSGTLTLTIYETQAVPSLYKIQQWRKQIYHQGYYGLPVDYKRDIVIELLANGDDTVIGTLTAIGCWPSSVNSIDLSYDSSEKISIEATFTVDRLEFEPLASYGDLSGFSMDENFSKYGATQMEDLLEVASPSLIGYTDSGTTLAGLSSDYSTAPIATESYSLPSSTPSEASPPSPVLTSPSSAFSFSSTPDHFYKGSV